jgi:radical SAM protein with 4Fe4S-binding SPASM domain
MDPDFLSSVRGPSVVGFEVTPYCNRRCIHCEPAKVTDGNYYLEHPLSTRDVLRIIDRLGDGEVHYVFLTGGEPTFRDDLPQIIRRCFEREVYPNLLTTGERADDRLASELYDLGLENVQISMEGPQKIHDAITGTPGAFEKTVRGIKAFVRAGLNVCVTSVAMKPSLPHLAGLIPELAKLGVYGYGTVRLRAHRPQDFRLVPTKNMLLTQNERIKEACGNHGVELLKIYDGLGTTTEEIPDTHYPSAFICNAGKIKMEILSNGDVVPCKSFKRPDFVVGNLLRDTVEDVWNHSVMRTFRHMTPDEYLGECAACELKVSCHCCRAVAYNLTGELFSPDPSCCLINSELCKEALV